MTKVSLICGVNSQFSTGQTALHIQPPVKWGDAAPLRMALLPNADEKQGSVGERAATGAGLTWERAGEACGRECVTVRAHKCRRYHLDHFV